MMPATTSRVAATLLYVNERTRRRLAELAGSGTLERTVSEIDYERYSLRGDFAEVGFLRAKRVKSPKC